MRQKKGTDAIHSSGSREGDRRLRSTHNHASPQQPTAGSEPDLVFKTPFFAIFQDPHGCFSSGAQCNSLSWWLPLLSQASGTNKTWRENPHFTKPALPQNCSVSHLWEGGGTASVLKRKSSLSSLQQWHNPNETASSILQYPGAPGSRAQSQLPALVQVSYSCIYHFIIASSL